MQHFAEYSARSDGDLENGFTIPDRRARQRGMKGFPLR
jgi:hypothetical protein